MEVFLLILHL